MTIPKHPFDSKRVCCIYAADAEVHNMTTPPEPQPYTLADVTEPLVVVTCFKRDCEEHGDRLRATVQALETARRELVEAGEKLEIFLHENARLCTERNTERQRAEKAEADADAQHAALARIRHQLNGERSSDSLLTLISGVQARAEAAEQRVRELEKELGEMMEQAIASGNKGNAAEARCAALEKERDEIQANHVRDWREMNERFTEAEFKEGLRLCAQERPVYSAQTDAILERIKKARTK
jgi:hypothetical protein